MSNNPRLSLFSDPCRSRFMAERNTKPATSSSSSNIANANAVVGRPSSRQVQHANPDLQSQTQQQMDQTLWLSRATSLIRAEEERRLMQMLLFQQQPNPNFLIPSLNHTSRETKDQQQPTPKQVNNHPTLPKRRKLNRPAQADPQQIAKTTPTPSRPPPLTLGK